MEHVDSIRSSDTINDFESLSSIDAQFMMGEKYPKNETFDIGNDIESLYESHCMSHTVWLRYQVEDDCDSVATLEDDFRAAVDYKPKIKRQTSQDTLDTVDTISGNSSYSYYVMNIALWLWAILWW